MSIPSKIAGRISAGLKRVQGILLSYQSRDVNEADTVIAVFEVLSEVFGFDKFSEITREHAIRGTYVDLAIELSDGNPVVLIEVKAIGLTLKESFIRQAVDYAVKEGVDWVVLTNGIVWQIYKVSYGKPVGNDLVAEFNLLEMKPSRADDIERLYILTKEGVSKSALERTHAESQAVNKFSISAVLLTTPVLSVIKRELKRLNPTARIDEDQILNTLKSDVIKREVLEGIKAEEAAKKVKKAGNRMLRNSSKHCNSSELSQDLEPQNDCGDPEEAKADQEME
jgi:predicted type IV restriction endonuclease